MTLFMVYTAFAAVGLYWSAYGIVSPAWPAAGIALAGLILGGLRLWPAIFLGRLAAGIVVGTPASFGMEFLVAAIHVVAVVLPIALMHRFNEIPTRLRSLPEMLRYLIGLALPGAFLVAALSTIILYAFANDTEPVQRQFATAFLASFVGAANVGVFALSWFGPERTPLPRPFGLILLLALVTLVAGLIFVEHSGDVQIWLLLPVLVLVAVLYDVRGAAAALAICALVAWFGYNLGSTPAPLSGDDAKNLLQAFLAVSSLATLLVAVAADQSRTTKSLQAYGDSVTGALLAGGAGTFRYDIASGRMVCDDALLEILGLEAPGPQSFDGLLKCLSSEDWSTITTAWKACISNSCEMVVLAGLRRPDGTSRVAEIRARYSDGLKRGSPVVTGTIVDITDREEMASRLLKAEGAYRAIFDHAGLGVARFSPDGRFLEVNDRYCAMLGAARDQLIGASYRSAIGPMDVTDDVAQTERLLSGLASNFRVERCYPRGSHPPLWLDISVTLVRTSDDEPSYFVSVVQDISVQKQAEAQAVARAQELEAVLTAVPAAIWVAHDAECKEVTGNAFASQILRVPDPQTNMSKTAQDTSAVAHFRIFDIDGNELTAKDLPVQRAARGEVVTDFEERLLFKDGSDVWLFGAATPLVSPDGKVRGAVAAFVDITARKSGEERERLLTREVDHRAKNIMAIFQAILRLTRAESIEEYRTAVEARIASLARTHSLLAENRWDGAELRKLLMEELTPYADFGATNRVTLAGPTATLQPETAQSVALLVHELVTNAVKYGALSTPKGHLDVRWSITNAQSSAVLALDWRETGGPTVGTPQRQGFGLTLIRSTVESQLDGLLSQRWVPSGLQVGVSFPTEGRVSVLDLAPGSVGRPLNTPRGSDGRILVLEDEPLIAMQIADEIEVAGYMVAGPAHNVADALTLIAQQNIGGAILDISLGSITSVEVADALTGLKIPFVFCSGYANSALLPERLAAVPRLSKPVATSALRQALQAMAISATVRAI